MTSRVVLITGASYGIGRAIAEHLVQQGYRVFGTSRSPASAPDCPFPLLALDVTRPESIQACVREVLAQAGRIDALVNNAGMVGTLAASEETTPEDWNQVFQTNFFGAVQMTNAVLPIMRQQQGGRIINISSAAGFIAMPPYTSIYAASKHALEGYTEALRYELRPFSIFASAVRLGYVRTNIGQSIRPPQNAIAAYEATRRRVHDADLYAIENGSDPQQVAHTVARALKAPRPKAIYYATADSHMLAIIKKFMPSSVLERFLRYSFLEGAWNAQKPDFLRRLLLNTQAMQRFQRAALAVTGGGIAIVALALLLVRPAG